MTEKEKKRNEEFAIWAGFERRRVVIEYFTQRRQLRWCVGTLIFEELPDFPSDESACFKWLVPYLGPSSVIYYGKGKGFGVCKNSPHTEADAETAALAICKVVEKLIDRK